MGSFNTKLVDKLICSKLEGELDAELSNSWIARLEEYEQQADTTLNRFHDVRDINAVHLSFDDLWGLAQRRMHTYEHMGPTRTVFLVSTPLNYGIARMYQALTDGTPFHIEVFYSMEEASEFLQLELEFLQNACL